MLNQRIENKGIMHTVACQLADDLREELGIFGSYTVEKREDEDSADVLVYSDQSCNILTSACIENTMEIIGLYRMLYDLSYHFGTIKLGEEEDRRILPCFYVCLNVQKVR